MDNADGVSKYVEERCGPNGLVSWYLMASLAYYHFDQPILSDARYDEVSRILLESWREVTHRHRNFLTEDDLRAGTCPLSLEQYPLQVRGALVSVWDMIGNGRPETVGSLDSEPFVPPERLRYDTSLYDYRYGKSWSEVHGEPVVHHEEEAETESVLPI